MIKLFCVHEKRYEWHDTKLTIEFFSYHNLAVSISCAMNRQLTLKDRQEFGKNCPIKQWPFTCHVWKVASNLPMICMIDSPNAYLATLRPISICFGLNENITFN